MTDLTAKLTALLGTLGWRSDMENMPKGRPLIGLIPLEATGRQPAFVGEAFDMEPSALVDKWTGRWMTVTHWKPLDTPATPDPAAALLREAIEALEAGEAENGSLANEVSRLREALGAIAKQKLVREMDDDMYGSADFEGGYEAIVEIARALIGGPNG